jgi:hypothetical protein
LTNYKDIEKYISKLFVTLLGEQAITFGFSTNENERCLVERQNGSPLPDTATILTFRLDQYNTWRSQRYGSAHVGYTKEGREIVSELRTFKCVVNVMSKRLGDAFDSARFLLANLQNNRYNNFVNDNGRMLGIEQIGTMRNLSDLENGTWTERVNVEIQMNFIETMVINDNTMFVKTPTDLSDLPSSVEFETNIKK